MVHRDLFSSLFLFLLGIVVFREGFYLGFKVTGGTGPGFFPVLVGAFLAIISFGLFMKSIFRRKKVEQRCSFWTDQRGKRSFLLALFGCAMYPVAMKYLGFFLSSMLFLFFAIVVVQKDKWRIALVEGIAVTGIVYLILGVWLKANLPVGILGF
jgi:hypothetical protein